MSKKPRTKPEPVETDLETTEDMGALTTLQEGAGLTSLAIALTRAEVDQQIVTAHAYPRKHQKVTNAILDLVTLDDETAEECVYALPRAGKAIRGPSIRFAEIVASQWGNCRDASRVVHVDRIEKYVEAEGVFHDLETGRATTARVRRRIFDRFGRIFDDDMIMVTGNAACAIALRNAILRGVPKAIWRKAYAAVEHVIAGDVKTIAERRETAVRSFAAWGLTPERVFAALDVRGIEDIGGDELVSLTAMRAAIKSGEATVEALFPEPRAKGAAPKGLESKLGALAGAKPGDDLAKTDSGAPAPTGPTGDANQPPSEPPAAQPSADRLDFGDAP